MTPIDHLREIFHIFAGLLVWPVSLGLVGLAATIVIAIGAFAREAWDRRCGRFQRLAADQATLDAVPLSIEHEDYALQLEQTLQQAERRRWRPVNRMKLAVRVGPSLGLMGTLIPMASALQGLAEGNLPALASNMVTAFAATVVGLSISVVSYLLAAARENWVRADVEALAFHAERLSRRATPAPVRQVS
jgi:biopolymer transport protein ExbB/TolQ